MSLHTRSIVKGQKSALALCDRLDRYFVLALRAFSFTRALLEFWLRCRVVNASKFQLWGSWQDYPSVSDEGSSLSQPSMTAEWFIK